MWAYFNVRAVRKETAYLSFFPPMCGVFKSARHSSRRWCTLLMRLASHWQRCRKGYFLTQWPQPSFKSEAGLIEIHQWRSVFCLHEHSWQTGISWAPYFTIMIILRKSSNNGDRLFLRKPCGPCHCFFFPITLPQASLWVWFNFCGHFSVLSLTDVTKVFHQLPLLWEKQWAPRL